jgi:protocatechuate 3,4-dioxygenase beta subunit
MWNRSLRIVLSFLSILAPLAAQETRSMLFGRVLDAQNSAVVGATVVVRNHDTGVTLSYKTNETGYYEANLLMPGSYESGDGGVQEATADRDCAAGGFKAGDQSAA